MQNEEGWPVMKSSSHSKFFKQIWVRDSSLLLQFVNRPEKMNTHVIILPQTIWQQIRKDTQLGIGRSVYALSTHNLPNPLKGPNDGPSASSRTWVEGQCPAAQVFPTAIPFFSCFIIGAWYRKTTLHVWLRASKVLKRWLACLSFDVQIQITFSLVSCFLWYPLSYDIPAMSRPLLFIRFFPACFRSHSVCGLRRNYHDSQAVPIERWKHLRLLKRSRKQQLLPNASRMGILPNLWQEVNKTYTLPVHEERTLVLNAIIFPLTIILTDLRRWPVRSWLVMESPSWQTVCLAPAVRKRQ